MGGIVILARCKLHFTRNMKIWLKIHLIIYPYLGIEGDVRRDITYWSVRLSSRRGENGVNGRDGEIVILANYKFYFIRVHVDNHV